MAEKNIPSEDVSSLKYRCCFCSSVLHEPVKLKCGHHYCQLCVNNQRETIIQCLQCKEKTSKKEVVIDQAFKSTMETFNVICLLCNWTGVWKDYQNHSDQNHSNIICNYCKRKVDSSVDLDRHKKFSCPDMMIYCHFLSAGCDEQFPRKDVSAHRLTAKHRRTVTEMKNQARLDVTQKECYNQLRQLTEKVSEISKHYRTMNNCVIQMNDLMAAQQSSTEYTS